MSNVAEYRPPALATGGSVKAIVPQTMEEAYRLAKAVCMAGMAPKGMESPEKAMIAIMRGLEVGLTPFQALDKIAIVNGRPVIWGDGALALVRGSGLCESMKETIEGKDDARVAVCVAKRRGDPEPVRRQFSVADAKRAGLWDKQGPWKQFPERMLQMRARAFCLRDGFADVLGGLYLKEEFDGVEGRATTPPAPVPPPPPPPAPSLAEKQLRASVALIEAQSGAAVDFDAFAQRLRAELSAATSMEEVNAIYEREVAGSKLTEEELSECDAILREMATPFWTDGDA